MECAQRHEYRAELIRRGYSNKKKRMSPAENVPEPSDGLPAGSHELSCSTTGSTNSQRQGAPTTFAMEEERRGEEQGGISFDFFLRL